MDRIIRRAVIHGTEGLQDIGIRGDRIAATAPILPDQAAIELFAGGRPAMPSLMEIPIHLDGISRGRV